MEVDLEKGQGKGSSQLTRGGDIKESWLEGLVQRQRSKRESSMVWLRSERCPGDLLLAKVHHSQEHSVEEVIYKASMKWTISSDNVFKSEFFKNLLFSPFLFSLSEKRLLPSFLLSRHIISRDIPWTHQTMANQLIALSLFRFIFSLEPLLLLLYICVAFSFRRITNRYINF